MLLLNMIPGCRDETVPASDKRREVTLTLSEGLVGKSDFPLYFRTSPIQRLILSTAFSPYLSSFLPHESSFPLLPLLPPHLISTFVLRLPGKLFLTTFPSVLGKRDKFTELSSLSLKITLHRAASSVYKFNGTLALWFIF